MKTAALVVLGFVLLLAGIALLVLPGPGFVIIAAGLAVLAGRFDWARKPLNYAKGKAEQGVREVAENKWKAAAAIACGVVLLVLGVLPFFGADLPLLNKITAVFLVLSGLFLFGSVVYARRKVGTASAPGRPLI